MVLLFCTFFLTGYVTQSVNAAGRQSDFSGTVIVYILAAVPQILLTLYILSIQHAELTDFGITAKMTSTDLLRAAGAYLGIFVLLSPVFVLTVVLPEAGRQVLSGGYRWGIRSAAQLPLALALSVVSGYREELFFRSYLLTRLSQVGIPAAAAVAGTAALFCLGHLYEGIAGILVTAIQGVYLALVFLRFKNLHVNAFAHGLYNFTVFALSLVGQQLSF